jgi:hypothetical protein
VNSCWVWQLGNVKLVVWALSIKGSYQNVIERGMVKKSGEIYKDSV